ncbi:MAG: riboflavin synthase subunit alpha [Candidatus Eisenbacteria bacterium RBG_16_71_46]|nr:MAG: riboflavin synthase subunit alpha [Candidatus Eisenbacteria bacterium RBG_16_71_46]
MFTGLIEEIGRVDAVEERPAGRRLWIAGRRVLEGARVGDSFAVDGCCLTAIAVEPTRFAADVVAESLRRTTIGAWSAGHAINLERPLRLDQRLGGHLVQGHVDGVGEVLEVSPEGESRRVAFALPPPLARFVAEKGSLAVDGVSMTVTRAGGGSCEVAYVPHTLAATVAGSYAPGRKVNLEVDLLARYLARLLDEAGVTGRTA